MAEGYSIVPLPKGFLALRIIQLILAVCVLAISAYGVSEIAFNAFCLAIFTSLATIIFGIYYFVATTSGKAAYNFWAVFSLEIFLLIFWLCTFATLAALSAAVMDITSYSYNTYYKRDVADIQKRYYTGYLPTAVVYADLALSTLQFVLFIISFVLYTVNMLKHRRTLAGEQTDAPASGGAAPAYAGAPQAEKGAPAQAQPVQPTQQLHHQPDQQMYQQQPMMQPHQQVYQQQQPQQMYQQTPQQPYQTSPSPVSYVQHPTSAPYQQTASPSPIQQQAQMAYSPQQQHVQHPPQGYAETGGASAPQVVHH